MTKTYDIMHGSMPTPTDCNYIMVIPSTRRSGNVPLMHTYVPDLQHLVWIVKDENDMDMYREHGAVNIAVQRKGDRDLRHARNIGMHIACGVGAGYCATMDDDLTALKLCVGKERSASVPIYDVQTVFDILHEYMTYTGTMLGGVLSTGNPFYSKVQMNPVAFICAQMCMVNTDLLWSPDERYQYKDDWELTCRTLDIYGKVCRLDCFAPTFLHGGDTHGRGGNRGGLNESRTYERDLLSARAVVQKYSHIVEYNPRRTAELRINHRVAKYMRDVSAAIKAKADARLADYMYMLFEDLLST